MQKKSLFSFGAVGSDSLSGPERVVDPLNRPSGAVPFATAVFKGGPWSEGGTGEAQE